MNSPTISVLLPVGRLDSYLVPAIQSVLAQQEVALELITVGPEALSENANPLARYLAEQGLTDPRLVCIPRRQPGIANALNLARQHASGEYLARMDADDLCDPSRLQEQLKLSQAHNDECFVGACVTIFSDTNQIQAGNQHYMRWLNQHQNPTDIRNACFVESPMPHPTWFAHRAVWDQLGDYRQGDFPEDYDLVLRAWLLKIPMVKPEQRLVQWREHEKRLTHLDDRYRREAFTQLKAQTLSNARSGFELHRGRGVWIAGTGRNARYWHDALEACSANVLGFVDLDGPTAKQSKRNKPVITYTELPNILKTDLLITAVTAPRARQELKRWCGEHDLKEGVNYLLGG